MADKCTEDVEDKRITGCPLQREFVTSAHVRVHIWNRPHRRRRRCQPQLASSRCPPPGRRRPAPRRRLWDSGYHIAPTSLTSAALFDVRDLNHVSDVAGLNKVRRVNDIKHTRRECQFVERIGNLYILLTLRGLCQTLAFPFLHWGFSLSASARFCISAQVKEAYPAETGSKEYQPQCSCLSSRTV